MRQDEDIIYGKAPLMIFVNNNDTEFSIGINLPCGKD
jgi:hypothetical protein